ncbi:hypothetical protein QIS99_28820 [Streptomyces sp. B-S-A8]|uniref:Uncharacterized protein n=1 Tax=Streptomyces solicavernae TaxID=3043614 RepID=A0ABT6S0E7_9ACTN|nr:hypothetical protein [Streptomyces sp. B-S-A8]MDI3390164.1 hypothetical protein [Streptomyces sp. B-S-A8]
MSNDTTTLELVLLPAPDPVHALQPRAHPPARPEPRARAARRQWGRTMNRDAALDGALDVEAGFGDILSSASEAEG